MQEAAQPSVTLTLANGAQPHFPVPKPHASHSAGFVLGVRKCGSSIMNSMVMALARREGVGFLDIGGLFFKQNIAEADWCPDPALGGLLQSGVCHGGFRTYPAGLAAHPLYREGRKILLLRDPRDALVSEYFSVAYTHKLPKPGHGEGVREALLAERAAARAQELADFVLARAPSMNATMLGYRACLQDSNVAVFFYEDVILQKRAWLLAICRHFGWAAPPARALDHILSWADVVPAQEAPDKFIRRVLPGDHRAKLPRPVIHALNRTLEESMAVFGYR